MDKEEILKERAKKLASTRGAKNQKRDALDVIEFILGEEHYAIESRFVREVYPIRDFTPLPCVPPFVQGLINVRRNILPLISLKHFFEFPKDGEELISTALIMKDADMEFAISIDSVVGVTTILKEDLQQSLPTLSGSGQQFFKGVNADQLIVLDGEKLIHDPNFIVDDQAKT